MNTNLKSFKEFMLKKREWRKYDIDLVKGAIGFLLSLFILVISCISGAIWIGLIFIPLFVAVGVLNLKKDKPFKKLIIINSVWAFVAVLATILVSQMCVGVVFTGGSKPVSHIFNLLCVVVFCLFIYIIVPKFRVACFIGLTLLMILGTVNGFIYQFRGNELGPFDFLSLGTAVTVAKGYQVLIIPMMAAGWGIWLLVMFAAFSIPDFPAFKDKHLRPRLYAALSLVLLVLAIIFGTKNIKVQSYNRNGTSHNGYYLNFILKIRDSFVEKPKNYSMKAVSNIEEEYLQHFEENNEDAAQVFSPQDDENSNEYPDIVVIVNESFADFRIFGKDTLRTNIELTPFIDSLTEDTIRGYALTSVFGGNTANAGFEFLTGHSMSFLPSGSVPYQQYIDKSLYSIAHYLENLGYTTYSTHPFKNTGWSRNTVYPLLGFNISNIDFIETYPQKNIIREYVADIEVYDKILYELNNKETNAPMFVYGITMQNHGPFTYRGPHYKKNVDLLGYDKNYPLAEQYLSVMTHSDEAIESFINELKKREKDTVILFFGDHFPAVEEDFFKELHGGEFDTLTEQMLKYTVPFFIWANYDIEERTLETRTSLNYLSTYLLDAAGVPKDIYHYFLSDLEKQIPMINAFGYYSLSKEKFIPRDEAKGNEFEWINKYHTLQYNDMFETKKRRSDLFFDNYIYK